MNKEVNRNFKGVWIPKDVWLDVKLSWIEKLFLVEINSLDGDDGCYASNGYFSEFFKLSKGRCTQIIQSLNRKEYVSVEHEREGKAITKRVVRILNKGVRILNRGSKDSKQGYLENDEGNNTLTNNTLTSNTSIVIAYFKEVTGRNISSKGKTTPKIVKARLNEGHTVQDLKDVIALKNAEWKDNEEFRKYIRPSTLFKPSNFEKYMIEVLERRSKGESMEATTKLNNESKKDDWENDY